MLITSATLDALFKGYSFAFNKGFNAAPTHALDVAMKVNSTSSEEVFAWLGQFPDLREWIGDRVVKSLTLHGWSIKNRLFEATVAVKRVQIEDDTYGSLTPMFEQIGRTTRLHPDRLVFELLKAGFDTPCYDGQNFFDTDHPVGEAGSEISVSNTQGGPGEPWFLIDATQPMKPLVWQERIPYTFQSIVGTNSHHVFFLDEYLYGVRARVNAGFGLWQLAYASKQTLTADNYAAARAAMQGFRGDQNQVLGISPSLLVVGPQNEKWARRLLKATSIADGAVAESNIWIDSAELIVTPFL